LAPGAAAGLFAVQWTLASQPLYARQVPALEASGRPEPRVPLELPPAAEPEAPEP
jgi:hypothetical protein